MNAMIKQPKIEFRFMNTVKEPSTKLPKKEHNRIPPSVDPASMNSDRSGTVIDESEVLHVNSDIISSLIGGPVSAPPNPPKNDDIKLNLEGFDERNVKSKTNNLQRRSPGLVEIQSLPKYRPRNQVKERRRITVKVEDRGVRRGHS